MASRHLKRLQEASKEDEIEGISEEEEHSPVTTAKPNLFSLLNEVDTCCVDGILKLIILTP